MNIDDNMRARGEFPAERPLEALRTDHDIVRQLFDRYFRAQHASDKREAGEHLLLLLQIHTTLEESVFYPAVRSADPSLVAQCEQEHEQARPLIEQLQLMNEGDPQSGRMYRELADAILAHIEREEQQLFPQVERAGLDLAAIGHEMQACELRLIADHAQRPAAPGVRL